MARSAQQDEHRAGGPRPPARRSSPSPPAPADPAAWLSRVRGAVAPRRHNARTIAALTANPGCHRRALLDCAGVDKSALARHVGFPAPFGQSRFAITRGNAFEARVKADGGAELLRLLRQTLAADPAVSDADPAVPDADLVDPTVPVDPAAEVDAAAEPDRAGGRWLTAADGPGAGSGNAERYARTRALLVAAADDADDDGGIFVDHPLLRLDVAGQPVYLEPDVVAARIGGRFHVIEIKSFAVVDGQADPGKVSAAAIQAAVYVLALRDLLADAGRDPRLVSPEVVLVCPRDFGNEPTAALIDVRRQLLVLRRQLARMARVDELRAALPAELSFDLAPDAAGKPTRPGPELAAALHTVPARYAPDCLSVCELARFCRHEATGTTAALGRTVREELGGVARIETVLALAAAAPPQAGPAAVGPPEAGPVDAGRTDADPVDADPVDAGRVDADPVDAGPAGAELAEAAHRLRAAARLRAEVLNR